MDAIERGRAARFLTENPVVKSFVANEIHSATNAMISKDIADDAGRRDQALVIKSLTALWNHLEQTAAIGRDLEKKHGT